MATKPSYHPKTQPADSTGASGKIYLSKELTNISQAVNSLSTQAASTAANPVPATPAVAHEWVNSIDTTGQGHLSQPAFTDIAGQATAAQVPPLSSLSGAVTPGQVPPLSSLSGAVTPSQVPALQSMPGQLQPGQTAGAAFVEACLGYIPLINDSGASHSIGLAWDGTTFVVPFVDSTNVGGIYTTANWTTQLLPSLQGMFIAITGGAGLPPIGMYIFGFNTSAGPIGTGSAMGGGSLAYARYSGGILGPESGVIGAGTWANVSNNTINNGEGGYWCRVA